VKALIPGPDKEVVNNPRFLSVYISVHRPRAREAIERKIKRETLASMLVIKSLLLFMTTGLKRGAQK
jgi:hypothetical protein